MPFLLVEGVDGSGKSTQAKKVAAWLRTLSLRDGTVVHEFREPGSSSIGPTMREFLLGKKEHALAPETELMLFLASRAQVMRESVVPALQRNDIVVLDRSTISTLAYQISGRGLPLHLALPAIELATCGVIPDLTFVLLVDPETGSDRRGRRGDAPDRIESEGMEFHQRVYEGYAYWSKMLAHRTPNPWNICTIETDELDVDQVFERIKYHIEKKLVDYGHVGA